MPFTTTNGIPYSLKILSYLLRCVLFLKSSAISIYLHSLCWDAVLSVIWKFPTRLCILFAIISASLSFASVILSVSSFSRISSTKPVSSVSFLQASNGLYLVTHGGTFPSAVIILEKTWLVKFIIAGRRL